MVVHRVVLRRPFTSARLVAVLASLSLSGTAAGDTPPRPNVIVILADDLGYGELGCYGGTDAPTPKLDAMAKAGVRCTAGYVTCPVCSPTRAALLTGRYQQRFGHEFNIPQSFDLDHPEFYGLPVGEKTLADRLRAVGYRTAAIGKWHLGIDDRYHPLARGFDSFFGFLDGGRTYFPDGHPDNFYFKSVPPYDTVRPRLGTRSPVLRGCVPVPDHEYLTDAFTCEAVQFIDDNRTVPFFLYLAYNAAHTPITPCPRWNEKLSHVKNPIRRTVASMVAAMDEGIGAIRDRLRTHGIADNTLVVFLSDNGGSPGGKQPDAEHYSLNTPLRGSKGECYEGGIRVPYIVEWPAKIRGGTSYDHPVSSLDVVPTALAAAGAPLPDGLDGTDLHPYLAGRKAGPPHTALFWRIGAWKAVRQGDLKLIKRRGAPDELYDVAHDMPESHDLAGERPESVASLKTAIAEWERGTVEPLWTGQGPRALEEAAADDVSRSPPMPAVDLVAEHRARIWGDSFVPKSPPPAAVMSAVSLAGLPADERIAVTCLQALLAREQPRLFLVREKADEAFWMDWYVTKRHVTRFDSVDDWTTLLDKHRDVVKGAVIPDLALYRGDVLALNVAACEDLLVAPAVLAERLRLPVKVDLRGRFATYDKGLEWVWATYKDRLNPHLSDLRHPRLLPHGTFDHAFQWRGKGLVHSFYGRKWLDEYREAMNSLRCFASFLVSIILLAAANAATVESRADGSPPVRPNIVYMLADDLGWGDISGHGGGTPTPHIDRLFSEGVELRHCMVWCVCSPTRAMLLTGRHPFRVGTGPEVGGELSADETTIAEVFRAAGYRTGVFGKWHNGEDPDTPEFRLAYAEAWKDRPQKSFSGGLGANAHGFDEAWVYYGGGADYFTRRTVQGKGPASWWHNRQFRGSDTGYTDDLVTDRACEFIAASAGKPFFCYVPFHIVHAPMQAKDEDLAAVDPSLTDPAARIYSAMVRSLDKNVGRILASLTDQGLRDDTIVVFSSDNGAAVGGSNRPLRGTKHSIYEGGVRMPSAIHWPRGGLQGRPWNGLMSATDMLPTLTALAGVQLPETRPLDGRDVSAALRENRASPVESVYWTWHGQDAIRTDRWKFHRFFDRVELYDIQADPAEATDVAASHPDVVMSLRGKMDEWAGSLSAALSHLPPAFDPPPAPEGDALEISVTVTPDARPKDTLGVQFATNGISLQATDHVEYDVLVVPGSLDSGFFYSPGVGGERPRVVFKKGDGVDQFGREQAAGPAPRGGAGVWEHRVIGLCSYAPGAKSIQTMVFSGRRPGTFTVHIDNLRIRHADGSTTPIWTDRSHTRFRPISDGTAFTDARVRPVTVTASP